MTVYYFSACGHSLAAAEYCAGAQNAPLLRILPNGTARAERPPGTVSRAVDEGDQTAIVVFPVYCQAIPRPVRVFLRGLRAGSVILLATYGRVSHGNVLQKAQKITPTRVCGAAYRWGIVIFPASQGCFTTTLKKITSLRQMAKLP